jgi:hypothetical protein
LPPVKVAYNIIETLKNQNCENFFPLEEVKKYMWEELIIILFSIKLLSEKFPLLCLYLIILLGLVPWIFLKAPPSFYMPPFICFTRILSIWLIESYMCRNCIWGNIGGLIINHSDEQCFHIGIFIKTWNLVNPKISQRNKSSYIYLQNMVIVLKSLA